ncbi:MAG: hypothetical protein K2H72_04270 [Muribaculaceae bacterium]|nr:hypothetical protein [Muribaculaceae bacterium]
MSLSAFAEVAADSRGPLEKMSSVKTMFKTMGDVAGVLRGTVPAGGKAGASPSEGAVENRHSMGYAVRGEMSRSESALSKTMKATTVKTYGWWRDNWEQDDTYTYTYDASGNITSELLKDADGACSRTVYEYNADGMVTFKETTVAEDGVNFMNSLKTEFEYDPIMTNVITKRSEWMWMDEDGWQQVSNNYERRITRNDKGDVESVVIAVLYDGEYDPTQRLTITYGENGEAIEMAEQILDYNGKDFFWEDGAKVTDIVWERTDGQFYDMENIFGGTNRVKSCTMIEADGMAMDVDVEYADGSDDYTAAISMTMDGITVTGTMEYALLENGGERLITEMKYMGMVIVSITQEILYDEWGLMTLQKVEESDYGEVYVEGRKGEVEYDSEGKPAVYTVSEFYTDEDTGEEVSEYFLRAEYSDYVDVTAGVGNVNVDAAAPSRYYNLQGMPVGAPEKGSIVIRDGKKIRY